MIEIYMIKRRFTHLTTTNYKQLYSAMSTLAKEIDINKSLELTSLSISTPATITTSPNTDTTPITTATSVTDTTPINATETTAILFNATTLTSTSLNNSTTALVSKNFEKNEAKRLAKLEKLAAKQIRLTATTATFEPSAKRLERDAKKAAFAQQVIVEPFVPTEEGQKKYMSNQMASGYDPTLVEKNWYIKHLTVVAELIIKGIHGGRHKVSLNLL